MPIATLISSLLPPCGSEHAAHAPPSARMLPCAPAVRVPPGFVTRMLPCLALSSCRHSAAYLHLDAMSALRSGMSFLHSDAVVHAVLIVTFTSVICTSAGVAGTERSFLGQQMRCLTAT